jgi:GTP-binding protein
MFVDQADIEVLGGDGGRGCVSFRKEKYIPEGGPDGGDGGDGGSVYLQATAGVDTLLDMVGRHHWRAGMGDPGFGKKKAGKDGHDLIIHVPPGTLIYDRTSGLLIADLKTPGQQVCIAKGGHGGKGNVHFMNSIRQAPDFAEPGGKGQVRSLHLELRLIADVGVVGLPNAGKSTLLSRVSHARPKIADYPFTTLVPQLGIAELDTERRLVIADIPGIIEGAHEGAGLGQDFLRHIERTRVIVHILDVMPLDGTSPIEGYRQIRAELQAYSPKLAAKPEILAANKMDLAGAGEALADLRQALPGKQIFAISAVAGTGMRPLMEALWQRVKVAPEAAPFVAERPYVPTEKAQARPDKEMFAYVEGDADEADWEPVDGEDKALEPMGDEVLDAPRPARRGIARPVAQPDKGKGFIDAQGDAIVPPRKTRKLSDKTKRTLIEPVERSGEKRDRRSAKERKAAHDAKVRRKKAAKAPRPALPAPVEPDAVLAAEIEAIKADDARKGKFYHRRKSDV